MMKKLCSILTAGCLLLALLPLSLGAAAEEEVILTFPDTGIVGTAGEGYTVEGTALTVTSTDARLILQYAVGKIAQWP
jgi:hypothetical protein